MMGGSLFSDAEAIGLIEAKPIGDWNDLCTFDYLACNHEPRFFCAACPRNPHYKKWIEKRAVKA